MSHKEELQGRANALQQEIQDLSKQFEMKKEEFLKVQGALEMLQILENEKNSKKNLMRLSSNEHTLKHFA